MRGGEFLLENPREKIVIFTTFRATARYLARRLNEAKLQAILIWGNHDEPKQTVINRFKNSTTIRVLVSTEVAAEDVDLQFCRVIVNYDLPWNPTRIEQHWTYRPVGPKGRNHGRTPNLSQQMQNCESDLL